MKRGLLLEEMTVRQEVNYTKLLSSPARGTWVEIVKDFGFFRHAMVPPYRSTMDGT